MRNNIRTRVIHKWKSAGRPDWSIKTTRAKCMAVDRGLERRGVNPAPRFREHRKSQNRKEIKHWVYGFGFPCLKDGKGG